MRYTSTRGGAPETSPAAAVTAGIAPDGGLYIPVPAMLPKLSIGEITALAGQTYVERAMAILAPFFSDFTAPELRHCLEAAYAPVKFGSGAVAPVVKIGPEDFLLELWHGPTSAFKDMALQFLPHLVAKALAKTGDRADIVILVATSGDTGKAALEGFRDVERTRIFVFFPFAGVSEIQRLQMVTQEGRNVAVAAIRGNFDDAQAGVKKIFNDQALASKLAEAGFRLSSANSINWGRLAPQIAYYFSAYADLVNKGWLPPGAKINFAVPTGNFGNILAGYYARLMGLPIGRLICASNRNKVLTDFFATGIYDRNRAFFKTTSPSMDILVSSNLERLLYHLTGDPAKVREWMAQLNAQGRYSIGDRYLESLRELFWAGWADDARVQETIGEVFRTTGYVLDPHTAVAWHAREEYRRQTGDATPTVIVSTASPFKFGACVLAAIAGCQGCSPDPQDEFAVLDELASRTGWPVPEALRGLQDKPERHTRVCDVSKMQEEVARFLGLC